MLAGILGIAGIALLLGCFAAIALASYRHFAKGVESRGNFIVRVLTLGGTGLLAVLAIMAWPQPIWLSALTLLLGAISLGVFRAAIRTVPAGAFHVAFTGDGPEQLVTSGIYGRIRNPLYTSYLAYWAAWVPATSLHPMSVACFGLFLSLYWVAVREEERFLSERFGTAYSEFKLRSGRFLPRLHVSRT